MQARIKQRILGFIVLLALAVVFLPAVLDGNNGRNIAYQSTPKIPQREIDDVELRMPERAKGQEQKSFDKDKSGLALKNNETVIQTESKSIKDQKDSQPKIIAKKTDGKVTSDSNNHLITDIVPEKLEDKTEESTIDDKAFNTWVVQVGSFSNRQNAKRLRDKLRNEKFKVFIRTQKSLGRLVNVVYVGQFATKEEANTKLKSIEKVAGLKVIVLPFEAVNKTLN